MTHIHWRQREDGAYAVLEFPRGPQLGRIRCLGTRRWAAECEAGCGVIGEGRTRPAAAVLLSLHNARTHLR
jgi:hypothetical protein